MATATTVRTLGLSKRFGASDAPVGLDLEVAQGEVLGYLGPNCAGKTTTLRLLMGLLRPTSGRAEIFGLDVHCETVAAHRRVAYVPVKANLWPALTGEETLHLLGGADIGFTALASAGLNVVPAGLLVLGTGTLAHGLAPRLTSGVVHGLVVRSFTAELVGAGLPAGRWWRSLSILHRITRAPAEAPRWGMSAVLVLIGVGATVIGLVAFTRRDLEGG